MVLVFSVGFSLRDIDIPKVFCLQWQWGGGRVSVSDRNKYSYILYRSESPN